MFHPGARWFHLILLAVGVMLLLIAQGVIQSEIAWQLILAVLVLLGGIQLIIHGISRGRPVKIHIETSQNDAKYETLEPYTAIFGAQKKKYLHEPFRGADIQTVFGSVKLDLREAIFEQDAVIRVATVFGGVTLLVPDHLRIDVTGTNIFGGISDKTNPPSDPSATLYVQGTTIFGGVEIQ